MCENPFAMSSTTGGDATSASYWMISYRGSFYSTPNMYVSNCDGNQAFNEDSTCLDENPLDTEICISTQSDSSSGGSNSLWNNDRTFQIFDELCLNDKPVYHYVQQNDSTFVDYDNYTVEEVEETSFYVHYQVMEIDVSGNETIGMWMLSQDEISTNYLAYCQQEDLEDCTANNWYVQTLFISHGNLTDITLGDGYIDDVIDAFMTITNGHCDSMLSNEEDKISGDEWKASMIGLCVVMLLMLVSAAPFGVQRWLAYHGNGKKEAVADMEEEDVVDPEPDHVQALDVDVRVNLSNDDGDAITTTQV